MYLPYPRFPCHIHPLIPDPDVCLVAGVLAGLLTGLLPNSTRFRFICDFQRVSVWWNRPLFIAGQFHLRKTNARNPLRPIRLGVKVLHKPGALRFLGPQPDPSKATRPHEQGASALLDVPVYVPLFRRHRIYTSEWQAAGCEILFWVFVLHIGGVRVWLFRRCIPSRRRWICGIGYTRKMMAIRAFIVSPYRDISSTLLFQRRLFRI